MEYQIEIGEKNTIKYILLNCLITKFPRRLLVFIFFHVLVFVADYSADQCWKMEERGNKICRAFSEREDEAKLRTLWCGSLSEKVDDRLLYELFLNAGPLEKVTIPR